MDSNDDQLIRLAQAGDRSAAEILLRRHEALIFDFLLKILGNAHDAEDAAQETMVKILRALPRYQEKGLFKAWVFQIAKREGLRLAQRRRLVLVGDRESLWAERPQHERVEESRDPSQQMIGNEMLFAVKRLIERLPLKEREVFLLRTQSGLSFAEIADETGCPLNTALGRMRNAVIKLKRWMVTVDI